MSTRIVHGPDPVIEFSTALLQAFPVCGATTTFPVVGAVHPKGTMTAACDPLWKFLPWAEAEKVKTRLFPALPAVKEVGLSATVPSPLTAATAILYGPTIGPPPSGAPTGCMKSVLCLKQRGPCSHGRCLSRPQSRPVRQYGQAVPLSRRCQGRVNSLHKGGNACNYGC